MRIIFMPAAALLWAPFLISAKEPVQLAPSAPWNLHYGGTSCQLIRTFGNAEKSTTLVLERIAPRSNLSMLVYGGSLKSKIGDRDASAVFIPLSDNLLVRGYVAETLTEQKQTALLWNHVYFRRSPKPAEVSKAGKQEERDLAKEASDRAEETASAAMITALEVRESGRHTVVLRTGPLARPIALMRDCANEQLQQWGVDPAVEDKIIRHPVATRSLTRLFNLSDYPMEAIRTGAESLIQARLNIGADGIVTKCTSLTRFKAPAFDEVVCDKLKSIRFKPAELADGTNVPSYDLVSIRFLMPG